MPSKHVIIWKKKGFDKHVYSTSVKYHWWLEYLGFKFTMMFKCMGGMYRVGEGLISAKEFFTINSPLKEIEKFDAGLTQNIKKLKLVHKLNNKLYALLICEHNIHDKFCTECYTKWYSLTRSMIKNIDKYHANDVK